ncbi:MAG TPA: MmgE/PrpD family protein, partial [Burkholderiales bacterium]|nr:MmgE/PrpD family protein [Burkholderiales bacterium]
MASISRQLAQWIAGLRYEDLPPAVIDRAKGVTLQAIASVLIGSQTASGKQALKMIADEEAGVKKGATLMVDGTLVTKGGAAYANSETALSGGKYDTFRMLTHPNTAIIPAALVAAESTGASGKTYLTGVVAGYEA